MNKVFSVPSPTHLVKFAAKEFWEGKTPPFVVSERCILGKFIYSLLIDKRSRNDYAYESESILSIQLSDTLAKRSPTLSKLLRVNLFLQEHFDYSLMLWVKAQMQIGSNRYQAVLSFLRYFDLDTPKMIQRSYQFVKRNQNLPYRLRQIEKMEFEKKNF